MSVAVDEARRLLDKMPEDASWDDIMYQFYVRKKVEKALEAAEAGELTPQADVRRKFPAQ